MKKPIYYFLILFSVTFAFVVPVKAKPRLVVTLDGDPYYTLGLGLTMNTFEHNCTVNENDEVECVFDITATRTSTFWGGTELSVYVPVDGIVSQAPAYWLETDTHDNNEGHFEDTILLGFSNGEIRNETCDPYTDSVSPLGGNGGCDEIFFTNDNGAITFYTVPTGVGDLPYVSVYHIEFTWSQEPIDPCAELYPPVEVNVLDLDPTIETPAGPPTDEQIIETTTGEVYKIALSGGPWNDGTTDRGTDTAFSWDGGTTWTPYDELVAVCEASDAVYVMAESDELQIRVDDTTGNFADNTNNPDPVTVTITLTGDAYAPCDTQFTYDEMADWVASVVVQGDDEDGVLATDELVTGEWYAIEVASGAWQDDGAPPDLFDMEYYNGPEEFALLNIPYTDLSTGSNVYCQSSDSMITYMQAEDVLLYLRVNNVLTDFVSNTGALNINIYHTSFTRTPDECETTFAIGDLIDTGTVDATQENGSTFAFMVGTSTISHLDSGLTPGAWYVLDTTEGPWQWQGAGHAASGIVYDMAVSEDGDTWGALADWERPVCNILLDGLGHRRVIFQMPESGALEWKLRVNDSAVWFNNSGMMSWNLYGAVHLQDTTPDGGCDYDYDLENPVALGEVQGDDADGVLLEGMIPGNLYALKVVGNGYGWTETFLSETLYETELSPNNGLQYYDLPEGYPATLCSETSGNDVIVFLQAGQNFAYRLRVNSTTFEDNTGSMGYVLYPATAGQSISNTCFDGWSANAEALNGFDWIDVRSEEGELIAADTARWEEFNGLIAGRVYMITTPAGQGPWWSNDDPNTMHYDVALTNDNGTTWEGVSLTSTMIDCASYNAIAHEWKIKITVQDGETWKIRVNDTAGAFSDNQGNMAYKLQTLCDHPACTPSIPDDSTTDGIPAISIQGGGDVCTLPIVRPAPLSISEILDLGNYVGAWVQYINLSVLRYMAWCPVHTDTLFTFLNKFYEKEPLATVKEWTDNLREIKRQIESYNWGPNSYQNTSIFDVDSSSELQSIINEHILPSTSQARNPWSGGNIVSLSTSGTLPDAYYSCSSAFIEFLPSRLRSGVCFASAWFIETSASFWIQLVLDISAFGLLLGMIKGAAQELIYMMTGVRQWTKSGAERGLGKLISYLEGRDRLDDIERELNSRFGGSFRRNSDGSYSRR